MKDFNSCSCSFLLAQKGTKKGPAIEYSPMAEGALISFGTTVRPCFSSLE